MTPGCPKGQMRQARLAPGSVCPYRRRMGVSRYPRPEGSRPAPVNERRLPRLPDGKAAVDSPAVWQPDIRSDVTIQSLQRDAGNAAVSRLLVARAGASPRHRLLQRLPLELAEENTYDKFKARSDARWPWHKTLGDYVAKYISPEIAQVTADDKDLRPRFGHEWKLSVAQTYHLLMQSIANRREQEAFAALTALINSLGPLRFRLALVEHDIEDLETRLSSLEFQQGERGQAPTERRTDTPPAAGLAEFKAKLFAPDPAKPIEAERQGRGAILRQFIADERRALFGLVEPLRGAHAVFSLERGGSFVADALLRLMTVLRRARPENVKVPKPTVEDVQHHAGELERGDEGSRAEARQLRANLQKPREDAARWAGQQRQVHAALFKRQVIEFVSRSAQTELCIAITETAVSGASVNTVIEIAADLVRTLKQLVPDKRVVFKILGLREMIKKHPRYVAEGVVRVQDPLRLLEAEGGPGKKMGGVAAFPPSEIEAIDVSTIKLYLSQVQYLLAEDVDFELAYGGEESKRPVVVFDAAAQRVVAVQIAPGAGADSARMVLLDLIAGVYDDMLERAFAQLAEPESM